MDPVVGVLVAAVLGPLGAYIAAARRFSGKIASSDAAELWEESRSIRDWSTERIADLNATVARLEGRVQAVEEQNSVLASENLELRRKIVALNRTIADLRRRVTTLTSELEAAEARVKELEEEAGHDPG